MREEEERKETLYYLVSGKRDQKAIGQNHTF
jgi:hypothetical protein